MRIIMTDHLGRPVEKASPPASSEGKGAATVTWRRCCGLALGLSVLSVLLCAVNWSQNAATLRRLELAEQRLAAFDAMMETMQTSSSQARSRTIRQVASSSAATSAECQCPPGKTIFFSFTFGPFSFGSLSLRLTPFYIATA